MRRKKGESFLSPLRFFYVSRAKFGFRHLPSPTPFCLCRIHLLFCMCIYYTPYLVLLSREKNYILCFWRFEQKEPLLFSLLPKERKKARLAVAAHAAEKKGCAPCKKQRSRGFSWDTHVLTKGLKKIRKFHKKYLYFSIIIIL